MIAEDGNYFFKFIIFTDGWAHVISRFIC